MLVIALDNKVFYTIKYDEPTIDTRQQVSTMQLQPTILTKTFWNFTKF